ncbi:MAG TPA: DUF3460 family protein [Burkholderiaceae bacterium]
MNFLKQFNLYESEADLFIKDLKANNPAVEAGQIAGRARLWDKAPIELDEQGRTKDSQLKQQPYVYQSK